ncbi:MAG: hypothetical protein PSX81_02775 [bacterium]|nr:hypothetical protein [bacterium]
MPLPILAVGAIGAGIEALTGVVRKTVKGLKGKTTKRKPKAKAKRKKSSSSGKKANGTLKKGFRYAKGGRVVKAKG